MPETGGASVAPKKSLTLDDLIAAIDRHERNPSNIPKVDTFHFCGERVSEWLERVEQTLVGRSDVVKFQRILQYVLHNYHQEVKKVIDAAQGSWERFREGMQRKYRLGDELLTTADLEAMNKEDFTTIGTFVQEFKKRARKVHGISEEAQCAIFLGLLTTSEAVELTRHGGGSTKLIWATIDRGVKVGCLDQVGQRQVRLQRQKRKERDATASGTPRITRIVIDVLGELGYATEPLVQRRVVTAVKVKGKEPVIEEAVQEELWKDEESVPQHLTKVQRKCCRRWEPEPGQSRQRREGWRKGARHEWRRKRKAMEWSRPGVPRPGIPRPGVPRLGIPRLGIPRPEGYQDQGDQGSQGYGRPRFDWRTASCQHCDQQSYTIRFCNTRREDERSGLIFSTMDGNIYDQFAEAIDRRLGGVRVEAQRRAAVGPPPPAMFRLWQEKQEPPIGVEEVGNDEEVAQGQRGGSKTEEPMIIESDDEDEEERMEPPSVLFGKMEELLDKMGRYHQKLVDLCEEVKGWRSNIPKVFLYDSGPESAPGRPGVNVVGSCPQSGMMGTPLTPQTRLAQAARTRNQAKASASQVPPRRETEPRRRKEAVEVEDDDDEEDEDERLRREEDQRTEQRARKKGTRGEAEPVIRDGPPKKKKYVVRLEEGFDIERVIDRLLEGHNDLMTLKEILASAPRLRDELKGRLSRRLVPNVHLGPCRINEGNEEELIIGESDFLLPQDRILVVELMKRRHRAYAFSDEERGRLDVDKIPMIRIHTVRHEPWNMRGARYPNPDEKRKVVDYLDGKIHTHVADYSSGPYASPWFCFIKPNGTLRWVQDLQRFDAVTVRDVGGLPNADALSESRAGRPIILLIDLYSGYDQFPVYPPDKPVTAMHTPRGLIHMNVAPQGWTNTIAMVQRAMIRVMQSVSPHITQPYIDDLAVKGPTVKESDEVLPGVRRFVWEHLQDLEKVLSLLEEHNLTASGAKSRHCMRGATILGFICSEKGRRPDVKKTDKITEWLVPFHSITDVRSFLGRHRGVQATYAKISELYYLDGMMDMVGKFCRSCVPCQERSRLRQGESMHPRVEREVGVVVHLDLLFMPLRDQGYNYIFDARDNLSGFVDGRAIHTKTGSVLVSCIEEYYLRYPFVREFVMDRGPEFTCQEVQELLSRSDFTKTPMPRGGKGTRPPQRPLGASGGYERHGPHHRGSTPVYNDGDIELFLDSFWEHARRMGWNMAQAIERLRGASRFEEPIARIRREATTRQEVELRMEELRPSPVGPDGRPIRLEIGNASDFIPAFEWFMQGQGIPRDDWMQTLPLWTRKAERLLASQIRSMALDWESCRAHLREAFRRPEPPHPRVERHQRSQRQRDPEPREARPSQGGRKALARREEEPEQEPEVEERGAYPECGLRPVEFHRFTEGGLRRSPTHTQEEPLVSEGPLRELETHLDISQWRASPQGEEHGEQAEEMPREEVSREEVPRKEVQDTQRERGLGDVGRRAGKEVIEVGEDTPPQTPAMGLKLGDAPGSTRQAEERLQREEVPLSSSGKAPSPEDRAERRRERAAVRREALILIDRHLVAHALEHPDLEKPAPAEPRQEPYQPEKEMEAEIPKRVDLRMRERAPPGETAEEKRARRTRRIDDIWQERQRLEAAGELLEEQQERQRSEAAGALPGKKMKEASHGVRLEAMEVEIQELRALVASQAAIIESLRQQTQEKMDKLESSRQGEQRQPGHGLPGQPSAAEPRPEPPMGRVILEPEEARAQRQTEREAFKFRAPTELATLPVAAAGPVVPLAIEEGLPPSSSESAQGSAEGSMGVLLEAVHTMQEEASLFSPEQRIEEPLEREMGTEAEGAIESRLQRMGTPEYGPEEIKEQPTAVPGKTLERRPQRLDTPENVPATGDLRSRLGSWTTGSGSRGPVPRTEQQEVVSTATPRSEQQEVVSTLVGSPSSPPPQPRKKKFKRKVDQLCFYCKRDMHHALDCLEFLDDKAAGKVSEVGGKMYDRQGRIVEKSADGLRAQLYRQNQEEFRR
ncbi:hypothetical protein CBR_g50452 [Chara braunii]|uniref:Reverse transcriptase domain-containing protein n=1 Tax=Chara braunii TaxID=69332 RepID=A0A388M6Q9_CHABU|nr:hypothetical protein CBR_g50452 [Chara braunii]|eukprot:GBG90274.1 hypothetical protein CBR_g50452 [Chara braunii]